MKEGHKYFYAGVGTLRWVVELEDISDDARQAISDAVDNLLHADTAFTAELTAYKERVQDALADSWTDRVALRGRMAMTWCHPDNERAYMMGFEAGIHTLIEIVQAALEPNTQHEADSTESGEEPKWPFTPPNESNKEQLLQRQKPNQKLKDLIGGER